MNPYDINALAAVRNASGQTPPTPEPKDTNGALRGDSEPAKPVTNMDMMKEISWSETDVLQSYLPFSNNPDPIVRAKGLKIYKEMLNDDQVKVCVEVRIQARLSTPWDIVPGLAGNVKSEEMAAFIKECLLRMRGNFESDMEQIYSAIPYGFSIAEKVFEYIPNGRFKGKYGLKSIKVREPYNYDFKVDSHGNLLGMTYVGMTGKDSDDTNLIMPGTGISVPRTGLNSLASIIPDIGSNRQMGTLQNPFPPQKFIVYPYNVQFGNWYGRSDLMAAFKWWLMKKHGSKFWAIWLERYASPFIWAQYKRDAGLKKEALLAIDDFIRNLSARQGVRVSDAVELKDIQFTASAGNAYEMGIEAYNRYIAHAILFPNLLGFTGAQGSAGGSYSLGQKQFDSFLWILNKMGRDMSETVIGEQIIKQLIEINYGEDVDMGMYPKFKFISIDDASIDTRSQIIQRLGQTGFVSNEEEWVRDFLTMPKKDPDIILPPTAIPGQNPNDPNQQDGETTDKPKPAAQKDAPAKPEKEEPAADDDAKMAEFTERDPDEFEEKVEIKKFKEQVGRFDTGMFEDASIAIEEMRDEILEKVSKRRLVTEEDPRAVSKLMVNAKSLNDAFSKWMVKIYLDSKLAVLDEMGRAGLEVQITRKFSDGYEEWTPLPPVEAVDFFARKVTAKIIDKNGVKKVLDLATGADLTFLKNRAFTIAGMVRDDILNDAKQIILNGIKRVDEPGTVKDLKDMFNRYLEQGVAVDGDLLKPHRLNTIVRTNVTEALNEGRAAMIEDPDVGDFVQFFEYSSIMDERTTEYCQCMDGVVFRVEDMAALKPPAHYNCRSFIVPITQLEVNRKKDSGQGIEVGQACPGRMMGFSDQKREPLQIRQNVQPQPLKEVPKVAPRVEPAKPVDAPAAPKASADVLADEKLKKDLAQLIVRCPYSFCQSHKIVFTKRRMNIGEYACEACQMPFRVSTVGDLYLYDAGTDTWERRSMGSQPQFFKSTRS